MKISQNIIFSAILLTISASAFATVIDPAKIPIIDLGGGTLLPASQLNISLEKLLPNIYYDVSCKIVDANNVKNPAIIAIQADYGAQGLFILNGIDIGPSYVPVQVKLPQVTNNLLATGIEHSSSGSLRFSNADLDDSIEISCTAAPSSQQNK